MKYIPLWGQDYTFSTCVVSTLCRRHLCVHICGGGEAGLTVVVVVHSVPAGGQPAVLLLGQPHPLAHAVRHEGEREHARPARLGRNFG